MLLGYWALATIARAKARTTASVRIKIGSTNFLEIIFEAL
jgi:hypothetical protein